MSRDWGLIGDAGSGEEIAFSLTMTNQVFSNCTLTPEVPNLLSRPVTYLLQSRTTCQSIGVIEVVAGGIVMIAVAVATVDPDATVIVTVTVAGEARALLEALRHRTTDPETTFATTVMAVVVKLTVNVTTLAHDEIGREAVLRNLQRKEMHSDGPLERR